MQVGQFPASAATALIEGYCDDFVSLAAVLAQTLEQMSTRHINLDRSRAKLERIERGMREMAAAIQELLERGKVTSDFELALGRPKQAKEQAAAPPPTPPAPTPPPPPPAPKPQPAPPAPPPVAEAQKLTARLPSTAARMTVKPPTTATPNRPMSAPGNAANVAKPSAPGFPSAPGQFGVPATPAAKGPANPAASPLHSMFDAPDRSRTPTPPPPPPKAPEATARERGSGQPSPLHNLFDSPAPSTPVTPPAAPRERSPGQSSSLHNLFDAPAPATPPAAPKAPQASEPARTASPTPTPAPAPTPVPPPPVAPVAKAPEPSASPTATPTPTPKPSESLGNRAAPQPAPLRSMFESLERGRQPAPTPAPRPEPDRARGPFQMPATVRAMFELLERDRRGGTLFVQAGRETLAFVFVAGCITQTASEHMLADERLGDLLVELGSCTRERLAAAFAKVNTDQNRPLGETLVREGAVSNRQIIEALELQVQRRVQRACAMPDAKFDFTEGDLLANDGRVQVAPSAMLRAK